MKKLVISIVVLIVTFSFPLYANASFVQPEVPFTYNGTTYNHAFAHYFGYFMLIQYCRSDEYDVIYDPSNESIAAFCGGANEDYSNIGSPWPDSTSGAIRHCNNEDICGDITEYSGGIMMGYNFVDLPLSSHIYSSVNVVDRYSGEVVLRANLGGSEIPEITALLESTDSSPLENKIPLILIHGNNMEDKEDFGWGKYLEKFDRKFKEKYKVYLFSWDSTQSNLTNGLALGREIDSLPELDDKEIVFLAYSRGGIIARYFMNRYAMRNGLHEGQLGGEKTKWLVTLGTPHRGSPGADPIWTYFSIDYNYPSLIATTLSGLYFGLGVWDYQTHRYLLWDDADDMLTDDEIGWCSSLENTNQCEYLMSSEEDLPSLNEDEIYHKKIITYGGNNYSKRLERIMTAWFATVYLDYTGLSLILTWGDHMKLNLATILMAKMPIIPNGYQDNCGEVLNPIDDSFLPFKANDGMVPLTSALFLKPGALNLFQLKKRRLKYDQARLDELCQTEECIVLPRIADHLDLLKNNTVIKQVIKKIKSLN